MHLRAFAEEKVDELKGRRLADIIGLGLKRQSPDSNLPARQSPTEKGLYLLAEQRLLPCIDVNDGIDDFKIVTHLSGHVAQCPYIFRKATAAKTDAGK